MSNKIDWSKLYPTFEDMGHFEENGYFSLIGELDCTFEIHNELKRLKEIFLFPIKDVPDIQMYLDDEISKCEASRDMPIKVSFFDGVDITKCFLEGWKSAISGGTTVLINTYKFIPEIKQMIEEKYPDGVFPENYFQRLVKVTMEEFINGNAMYRYYAWLNRQTINTLEHETAPPKTFDLSDGKLLEQLKPYFQDCSFTDLETIIVHKQLPIGRSRILWYGAKSDATRFIEHFGITKAQFNRIFHFVDNVKLQRGHRDKNGTPSPLSNILINYTL